jgi:acyl-CoA dehydrogenase
MSWEFTTEPDFARRLDWMREFVRAEIWPIETIVERLDQPAIDEIYAPLQRRVKEERLWACHLPPEYGGQGLGQVKLGLMHEILGTSHWAPLAFGCQAPDSGNAEILALSGDATQRERWLLPLLAGELKSGFSMTEPETAGSDPTLLATRAVRDGDGYRLSGRKWFTSNGTIADILIVMAVTDPDADPHRRASMFVVPVATEGVELVRDVPTMEDPAGAQQRFHGHSEVLYSDVRLGPESLLGGEGNGFVIAQQRLGPGRIHHCMRWLGVARRALDMLCERATYREAAGSVLGDKQTVQNWIADSLAELQAARLMTLHAAWVIDTEGAAAARQEIAMIKFYGAGVLNRIVDRAVQVHGALGYSTDLPLEAMFRTARAARLYDGPDEVHRISVARRELRRFSPPPGGVPSESIPARRADAELRFADQLEAAAERYPSVGAG